ncbi:MAG: transposase [Legionella sp.]|jgi:putative transposase
MPRTARIIFAGQPHHLIQRGNNRQSIFKSDRDYNFYLNKLYEVTTEYECEVHAYVLMTNHTHLLITPKTEESLSKMMLKLGTCYVGYFNHNHDRTGSLWEGRYKSSPILHEAYFLICMRYIELNPLRANIVANPKDYKWSSFHINALAKKDILITPHNLYLALGTSVEERAANYKQLFNSVLSEKDVNQIQIATRKSISL